jgi:hypothetical protein
MANSPVTFYGFTAVPRDPDVLFKDHLTASGPNPKQDFFTAADFPLPDSELVKQVRKFAKTELNVQTYNHSHRVYVFGMFMLRVTHLERRQIVGAHRHRDSADALPKVGVRQRDILSRLPSA